MNLGHNKKSVLKTAGKVLLLCAGLAMVSEVAFAGQVTASVFNNSPNDQKRNVTVAFENESLADALHILARKVKVGISYNTEALPNKLVTYQTKNASVYNVLDAILQGTGLQAKLSKDRKIILIKKKPVMPSVQQETITGTVTDASSGETLPGVNISVKGTTTGTSTDGNGQYELTVESLQDTLTFSFIGYERQEVPIKGRTTIDTALKIQTIAIEGLVVTAQGVRQQERSLGYSVASVKSDDIATQPSSDVVRKLKGKIPGVDIQQSGGVAGSATNITIRGASTVSGNNTPLFIVDGVRFNASTNAIGSFDSGGALSTSSRFLDLDPDNIESIDVLKGLAASTIYGEEGKNGVVLVTTRSGTFENNEQGFNVTLSQSYFVNKIASLPDYQNNYGNGGDQYYAAFFSNWGPNFKSKQLEEYSLFRGYDEQGYALFPHPYSQFSDQDLQSAFNEYVGETYSFRPHNNAGAFFRTGDKSSTDFNISGTANGININLSVGHNYEQGFVQKNDLTKNNISLGTNIDVFKNLSVRTTANVALTDSKTPPISAGSSGGGAGGGSSVFGTILIVPRSVDLNKWPYEIPQTYGSVYYRTGNDIQNPRWTLNNITRTDNVNRVFGKTELIYSISEWLDINYKLGLDTYSEDNDYLRNAGGVDNSDLSGGYMSSMNIKYTGWDHNILLNFDKQLSEDLNLNGLFGSQVVVENYKRNGLGSVNQNVFNLFRHPNFTSHSPTDLVSGSDFQYESRKTTIGVFMNAKLDYKNWLYLNLSGRNDWLSELEPENRSIFYPSASVSFIPTDAFNIGGEVLNYLKIRGGIGTSAGAPDPYGTRNFLSQTGRAFLSNTGVITANAFSNTLGNPNLKAEKLTEYELGLNSKFINGRIGIDLSVYQRNTRNLITRASLDPTTGYTNTLTNIGKIQNKGIEISLDGTPLESDKLTWNTRVNYTSAISEVKELGKNLDQVLIAGYTGLGNYAVPGEPLNVIKGSAIARDDQGRRLVDDSGDYLTADENKIIGDPNPDYNLAWINTLNYKNFSLNVQVDYQHGGDIYSVTIASLLQRGVTTDTDFDRQRPVILPGYTQDGLPNANQISAYKAFFNNIFGGADENAVFDATYLRLSSLSLSYQLPASTIKKTFLKGVTLTLSGSNLWYFTPNIPPGTNFDPSVHGTAVGSGKGLEFMTGPSLRQFGGSIKVQF